MEDGLNLPFLLLYLLLPLLFSPFTSHPGTLSLTLSILLVTLSFLLFTLALFTGKRSLYFSPLLLLLPLHFFTLLISLSVSPFPVIATGYTLFYSLFFLVFFLSSQGLNFEERRYFIYPLIGVLFVFLLQLLGVPVGGRDYSSTLGQKNLFALYLSLFSLIAFHYGKKNKFLTLFIILFSLFALILSRSRSGWLTFIFIFGIYLFLFSSHKKLVLSILIGAGLILSSLILVNFYQRYKTFKAPHRLTIPFRILVWKSGWEMFKDRPILGWGRGTFPFIFPRYRKKELEKFVPSDTMQAPRAHNEYLQVLVEEGVVGGVIFLSFWGLVLREIYKRKDYLNFSLIAGLLFHGLFSVSLRYPVFLFLLHYWGGKSIRMRKVPVSSWVRGSLLIFSSLAFLVALPVSSRIFLADYFLKKGEDMARKGDILKSEGYLEKAEKLNPYSPRILYRMGKIKFLRGDLPGAEKAYRRIVELAGDYVEVHANLARVYFYEGKFKEAIEELEKAKAVHPGLRKYEKMQEFIQNRWKSGQ